MKDATARRLSRAHAWAYRLSRGHLGRRLVNNDMLLLTTRGRRTGRGHTVPLLYLQDGGVVVVIASWGGRDYHPEWFHNLAADPEVTVNIGGVTRRVRARVAHGPERTTWWERALFAYSGYADYQGRTDREIPIVILDPIEEI